MGLYFEKVILLIIILVASQTFANLANESSFNKRETFSGAPGNWILEEDARVGQYSFTNIGWDTTLGFSRDLEGKSDLVEAQVWEDL